MVYVFAGIALALLSLGGPIMWGGSLFLGIGYMFYLNFKMGPRLTLVAIPVTVAFFVCCVWFKDFTQMYVKYVLLFVIICIIIAAIACKFYFEEGYKNKLIGISASCIAVTMFFLASWMYMPKDFSVPNKVDKIEIQQMSEPVMAVYMDDEKRQTLFERLDNVEMCGTFKDLVEYRPDSEIYRLTFLNKKSKVMDSYYFFGKDAIAKIIGGHYVFFSKTDDSSFPYEMLIEMYDAVVQAEGQS